jgi:glucosamine kinase
MTARPRTPIVIGVDGGGTQLRAVVLDGAANELARHEAPSVHLTGGSPGVVAVAIRSVVEGACRRAAIDLPVDSLWAGMAGAGQEGVRAELEDALARTGLAHRVGVGTDVDAAFHDAFGDRPGILLMAGTGSIAWGRAADGREARVGGWGWLLGDEGSGYAIGLEAMRRVVRSADGRAPTTQLSRRVLTRLRLDDAEDLIKWSSAAPRRSVAGLVPDVHAAALEGDPAAVEILDAAVDALEAHVLTLLGTLGPWEQPPTIALGGGLLWSGGPLHDDVVEVLRTHSLPLLERELDPARGAAMKALAPAVPAASGKEPS